MATPGAKRIMQEAHEGWKIEKTIATPDGILVFVEGAPFPMRTAPDPDAIFAANVCKKQILEIIRILSSWQFIPSLVIIALSPRSFIRRCLDSVTRIADGVMRPYYFYDHWNKSPQALCPTASEVSSAVPVFLEELGIKGCPPWKSQVIERHTYGVLAGLLLAHLLEYDSAYRWRLQDLCSSTPKLDFYERPARTLWHWSNLVKEREVSQDTARKISLVLRSAALALLHPSIRRALRRSLPKIDYDRLCLDLPELYWFSLRQDYNPDGKTYEERLAIFKEKGWAIPIPKEVVIS